MREEVALKINLPESRVQVSGLREELVYFVLMNKNQRAAKLFFPKIY